MTAIAHRPHPVTAGVAGLRGQLSTLAGVPLYSMDPAGTVATLGEIKAAKAQLAELEARVLVHADQTQVAADTGATNTGNWYAVATRTVRPAAHRMMRLAKGLDTHPATRTALAAGTVHAEQAQVILTALAELPDDLDPALTVRAEAHLLELADGYDAKALRQLGKHLLHVVAPDLADAHEARLLEREERDAQAATRLTMWDDGHGRVHGKFTLDTLTGAILTRALLAFAAPRHRAAHGPLGEKRPTPERLGRAFTELIQRYPTKKLPKAGGLNATVVVLMSLETLMGGLKAAHLDTRESISPGAARRLACETGIIPAVLGGKSQLLDLGRKSRYYNQAQRIAKTLQVGGCEIEGCDTPAGTTHMHHGGKRWADGGKTNLDDAIMICPPHHQTAHDARYEMRRLPTGTYTFHRRT